jgi:hypothetical protein
MKKMKSLGLSLVVISTLGFVGCGGGSSSSTSEDDTQTGTFVDAPVQGLSYTTATQSGVTDASGHFKYKSGETVTFRIGNLTLGNVKAKKTITPLTLGGDTNLNHIGTKAINIARILQSLDDNSSNSSIIVIPSLLQDLNVTNIDLESEADLQIVLIQAEDKTSKTYTLKSSIDAKNEMKSFLQNYLYTGSYSATSVYDPNSSSLPASQCGGTLQWTINIASDGVVTGNSTTEGNRAIVGISLSDSTISGIANDGTSWNATINEDGKMAGTYNYDNGLCVGTISGTKN